MVEKIKRKALQDPDCCWPVDSSCRSSAWTSRPRQTRRLRRPMTSWQRAKPRPPQVRIDQQTLTTSRLFFYMLCTACFPSPALTALTRITRCREEAAQRLVVFLQPTSRDHRRVCDHLQRQADSFRCPGLFLIDFAALTSWKVVLEVLKVFQKSIKLPVLSAVTPDSAWMSLSD